MDRTSSLEIVNVSFSAGTAAANAFGGTSKVKLKWKVNGKGSMRFKETSTAYQVRGVKSEERPMSVSSIAMAVFSSLEEPSSRW